MTSQHYVRRYSLCSRHTKHIQCEICVAIPHYLGHHDVHDCGCFFTVCECKVTACLCSHCLWVSVECTHNTKHLQFKVCGAYTVLLSLSRPYRPDPGYMPTCLSGATWRPTAYSDIKQNSFDVHADLSFIRDYIAYVFSQLYIVAIATHLHDDDHNDDDNLIRSNH